MGKELKLTVELVPQSAWGQNLRSQIPRKEWDRIRMDVRASQEHRCGICGAEGRLNCHEIWDYDDLNHTQKLIGFVAVCNLCNYVKHLGLASHLAGQGKIDMKKVEEHFMRVNECDLETFRTHAREAKVQFQERSRYEWKLDFGEYAPHIKRKENVGYTFDDGGPSPGDNMSNMCPECGSVGTVYFIPEMTNSESDGWMTEYEAGMIGFGSCTNCSRLFLWQG